MSNSSNYFDLYRKDSDNGGTKDWAIKVTNVDKITVKYGKTGSKLRTQEIPCPDPSGEAHNRTQEKLNKGYVLVGRYSISDTGKLTRADEERRYFTLSKVTKSSYEDALSQVVENINSFDFFDNVLSVEESAMGDPLFKCPGFLPESGWTFGVQSFQTSVSGNGLIEGDLQLLLFASLASTLNDMSETPENRHLTIESASSNGTEKSIIPKGRGLPDDFVQSLNLPSDFVLEVAQATGLIPMPVPIFNNDSIPTGIGICF